MLKEAVQEKPFYYGERACKVYTHARIEVFPGGYGFSEAGNKKVAEMTYEFVKALFIGKR